MKSVSLLALLLAVPLALTACSGSDGESPTGPGDDNIEGYPPVPRPTAVDDFDVPDESEIYEVIEPIEGKDVDFVPTYTAGTFTWDIDIQTQYQSFGLNGWEWTGDPPGSYWSGTRHNSQLLFEGGVVDLRNLEPEKAHIDHGDRTIWEPMPRRLTLVENGVVLEDPYNPKITVRDASFWYLPQQRDPHLSFDPPILVAVKLLPIEDTPNQRDKRRTYYVGTTAAPPLTNTVHMKRERWWRRITLGGQKSVRVDPGTSREVTYSRTTGMSYATASSFAETMNASAKVAPYDVGAEVGYATEEVYTSTREISEEETVEVSHTITGIEGKSIIFSVWQSVERYTFVDENGDPFTDPSYTFKDFGEAVVQGDHEILQSAIFDHQE